MLCFSPGKQLPLSTGWLRFSKEEKSIIERKPRGSPASPVNTPGGPALCGRAGSPAGPGSTAGQGVRQEGGALPGAARVPWEDRTVAGTQS